MKANESGNTEEAVKSPDGVPFEEVKGLDTLFDTDIAGILVLLHEFGEQKQIPPNGLPYPEVRAVVEPTDDPTPVNTFRVAQYLAYPCGVFMAKVLLEKDSPWPAFIHSEPSPFKYVTFFGIYLASIVHASHYNLRIRCFKSIFNFRKSAYQNEKEVRNQPMRKYKEAPEWWYLALLVVSCVMTCCCSALWDTSMSTTHSDGASCLLGSLHPVPVILHGPLNLWPYNLSQMWPRFCRSIFFNYYIKSRLLGWCQKYAYVLTSAFSTDITIFGIVIFVAVQFYEVDVN
ncbi:Glutathione transporter 1 [Tolypocladium paradoxum]|uniref:Glutathione transporter 1 n=1 Tax=Tolypocladium paradoxum TaxID=94208 RepID=A0A2S4KLN8_9HYPO|nr:Glutathione transporter 1 [Tolypocladium paradoxum]